MCEVGIIYCTSLAEAPSNLRAFTHAVPSTWLTCAQSLRFIWNGFSSGTHPMNSQTTLSPSPIRQCAMVFLCSTCLNYNWEHSVMNLLCRIHAGSLDKGSKNLAHTSMSTTKTQPQTICWVSEISGDISQKWSRNGNVFYSSVHWAPGGQGEPHLSPSVKMELAQEHCGCSDGHHQSPLHPTAFFTCLVLCLLFECILLALREILEPLFNSLWCRFSLSWKVLLISENSVGQV